MFCTFFSCSSSDRPSDKVLTGVPASAHLFAGGHHAQELLRQVDSLHLPPGLRRDLALFRAGLVAFDDGERVGALLLFLEPQGPEGPALGAVAEWEEGVLSARRRQAAGVTRYRGTEIFRFPLPEKGELYAAEQDGYLILGRFAFLVEGVVGRLHGRGVDHDLPSSLRSFTDEDWTVWQSTESFGSILPPGWLRLGLSTDPSSTLRLDGVFCPENSSAFSWLEGTRSGQPAAILTVLPQRLGWWRWRRVTAGPAAWPGVGDDPFRETLAPLAGAEQVLAGVDPLETAKGDRYWVMEVSDPVLAGQRLDQLGRTNGLLEEYSYQTYRIQHFLSDHFQPPGSKGKAWPNPYVVLLDKFVVFSDSRSGLELWVDQYLVGATLANDPGFLTFYQANDAPARAWWMVRPEEVSRSPDAPVFWSLFRRNLDRRPWMGVCWKEATPAGIRCSGNLPPPLPPAAGQPHLAWRVRLPAPALTAPQVLPVDDPAGPKLAIQDQRHRLLLIDAGGNIRTRIPLDAPVLSRIYRLDYYQDGSSQLLFNTSAAIYLLDANTGEAVGNFPIRLQSAASSGLALINFSGRGSEAFFVACTNGHIYGYDLQGMPLPGWAPRTGVGQIIHPILHFQQEYQDFLVALNTEGALWVFQRNGTMHFPPLSFSDTLASSPAFQQFPPPGRIVACDQNGLAHIVTLQGRRFSLRLEDRPGRPVHFALADITGDERADYLTLSGSNLSVHYYAGNALRRGFTYRFDHAPDDLFPLTRPSSTKAWIGVVDTAFHQVHLISPEGKSLPGFPLAGSTRFVLSDLFSDQRSVLIVADGEYMYAYTLPDVPN